METLIYPTIMELREIEPDLLAALTLDDPIFQHSPIVDVNAHYLSWEVDDNLQGLQSARGLEGDPTSVKPQGRNKYLMEPGVYGEFTDIKETEITVRAAGINSNIPIDISDLVRKAQDQLLGREVNRVRQIIWNLVTTGTFSVLGPGSVIMHTDKYEVQSYPASIPWGTSATATPLANFRGVRLLSRGSSVAFDQGATAYMNQTTFNKLITNQNPNDLAGRRVSGLVSPLSPNEIQSILLGEGLPRIVVFDDGYYDNNGVWQLLIPDDKVVVIGRRTSGARLGEYRRTRNAQNPGVAPGPYIIVSDNLSGPQNMGGVRPVPRKVTVDRGHNGGPVIFYANAVVVMSV